MWKNNENLNVKKMFRKKKSFLKFRDSQELSEKKQFTRMFF